MSIVLFTLGYQAHSYFNGPTKSTRRSISSCSKSHTIAFSTGSRPGSGSGSDTADASDTESDAEDEAAALTSDIASVRAKAMEEVKMVLVVNDSLKMSKGKIAAQAGHATLACAMMLKEVNPRVRGFLFQRYPCIDIDTAFSCSVNGETKGWYSNHSMISKTHCI